MQVGLENNWKLNNVSAYSNPYVTNTAAETKTQTMTATISNNAEEDTFVTSKTSEQCTDGKDDGKIGLFSAVGNALKGVGKTVVNGVKGMFTNSEGKFSIGKTLLSVGTAAVCIAFPAVGLAACAVGGVMGAIQVGKGVYNAATAETDAEAKEAWQNIGGGAFTVAASVAGAKASVKAVQSSAGNASALAQLDDTATIGQKAAALGKDMVTSTKNSAKNIGSTLKQAATTAKTKVDEANTTIKEAVTEGKSKIGDLKNNYSESSVGKAKAALKAAKESGNADDIAAAKAALKAAKAEAKTATKEMIAEAADNAKSTIKNKTGEITNNIKTNVTKENAANLWNSLKGKVKNFNIKDVGKNLSNSAQAILNELQNGSSTYAQAVQKYGYENVAQVIEYVAGYTYSNATI